MAEFELNPGEQDLGDIEQRNRTTQDLRQQWVTCDGIPFRQDAAMLGLTEHIRSSANRGGDWLAVDGGRAGTHYWHQAHPDFNNPDTSAHYLGLSYTGRRRHLAVLPPHVLATVTAIEGTQGPLLQFNAQPWVTREDGSVMPLDEKPKVIHVNPIDFQLGNVGEGLGVLRWLAENAADYPGRQVDEARQLDGYAPLQVATWRTDIPGFNLSERSSRLERPYSNIGGVVLTGVNGHGADSSITFVVDERVVTLVDSEISQLQIDHKFGYCMPAQGKMTDALSVQIHDGATHVLGTRFRALEFGDMDRIDVQTNPDFPSIGVYALYDAHDKGARIASLERAKQMHAYGGRPITYMLITPNGDDGAIITSCIGYPDSRKVQVWHPSSESFNGLPNLGIEMLDIGTTEVTVGPQLLEQLTNAHMHRLHARGIDPSLPVTQFELDKLFWYAMYGALPGRLGNGST